MTTATHNAAGLTRGASDPRPPSTTRPPDQPDRTGSWLLLLLVLLLATPALLIAIHRPDAVDPLEAQALATATQTQRHRHQLDSLGAGFFAQRLVPHRLGAPQFRQPPGVTWLHLVSFNVADRLGFPQDVETRILAARIGSAALALLTIAAVFWAGHSIGGAVTGFFAALLCAACPLFVYYGRIAAPPMAQTAFIVLAVAAALWAIRPLKALPSVERQFIGWTTCGLAMGAAVLTHGPAALPLIILPVFVMLLLCPNRVGHLMGLVAASIIGVLLVMPWTLYVQEHDPGAWRFWIQQLWPDWALNLWGERVAIIVLLTFVAVVPWTLWLIGAAVQPFSTSSSGSRTRLSLGAAWFIPTALLLSFQSATSARAAAVLFVPVLCVAIAALFRHIAELASEGRYVRFWRILRWPQLVLMSAATLLAPLWLHGQGIFVKQEWIDQPLVADPGWIVSVALTLLLAAAMVFAWRWAIRQFPAKALIAWCAWTLLLMWALAWPTSIAPVASSAIRQDADAFRELANGRRVLWLATYGWPPGPYLARQPNQDVPAVEPDPAFVLYSDVEFAPVHVDQLEHLADQQPGAILAAPAETRGLPENFTAHHAFPRAQVAVWRFPPVVATR